MNRCNRFGTMPASPAALAVLVVVGIFVGGCSYSYKGQIGAVVEPYQRGDFASAGQHAADAAKNAAERDRAALLLEQGAAQRAAKSLDDSTAAFDKADELFQAFDQRAKVRVSREVYAAVTSVAALDYEGTGYDRVMTNVYKALNYLELGRKDDARVEIKRVADAQERCEQRHRDQIDQARQARSQTTEVNADPQKVRSDARYKAGEDQVFADFPDVRDESPLPDLRHKALYANPFAEYLQGIFYLYSGAAGDAEVARTALRNTEGMLPPNAAAQRYLREAEGAASSGGASAGAPPPQTYVIFETGMAPRRDEVRIDLPIFLAEAAAQRDFKVDYVGVAFPKLTRIDNYHPYLEAATPDGQFRTEVLADVDKIVAREFKDEIPVLLTRMIITTGVKVAAQYGVAKATEKQDPTVQLLSRAALVVYQAAFNEADVRTWRTLPKQVQIASFPTPASGQVGLSLGGGAPAGTATVQPGKANVIWVRSAAAFGPPQVRTFVIN